ncbi:MAG TPA: AMP-binding protein [Sphingomonas sp.]|nr:AMP-binding protein [Sphingomonas sp.]
MAAAAPYRLVGIEKIVSVAYIDAVFACYRDGRIAVPIDPGSAAPAGHEFEELIRPAAGGGWFSTKQAPIREDRPAQVSFSSGTTGTPKAILLSHRALADVTDRLISAMEIDGEISEYLGVPPTYSFGLGRARVIAATGGRLFVPARGFDPTEFARMLEADEINALSAVPTLLRALMSIPDLIPRKVARKLRWLEIGSQPMSADEKQAIRRLFPAARIIQHYGLTEASRTTFLDIQEASTEELETVGRTIGATKVRIDGEDRICISGPHVAEGMLTPDGLVGLVDADGWLTTNDIGRLDERGFLTFLGRTDHLLNVGGIKVSAELFEQKLIDRLGADGAHVAVGARADALRGQTVLVAHHAAVPAAALAEHVRAVGSSFGLGAADICLVQIDAIPRTDTGKVQRHALTELAAELAAHPGAGTQAPAEAAPDDGAMSPREIEIAAIWRDALGGTTISRDSNFFDMGGDSLSAITVMLRMERAGISKAITQQIFEGRTIAEIAANIDGIGSGEPQAPVRRAETSDAITMTRGIFVLLVIISHWLPALIQRLGDGWTEFAATISPIFRAGTPGFAMIFGLGLGFFNLSMVTRSPERLRSNIRTNVLILATGVLALAAIRFVEALLSTRGLEPIWASRLFFNVLTAYLLLAATSGVILRIVARRAHPALFAIIVALASLTLSAWLRTTWLGNQIENPVDLPRLLLIAKYGYPEMLGYVLTGMAMGIWIERDLERDDLPALVSLTGVALIMGGMLLTVGLGLEDLWYSDHASAHMVLSFAGGVLLLFGAILAMVRRGWARGRLKVPLRFLLLTGILAFAAYVGHEMVLAAKDIFDELGVADAVSLTGLLLLFFGGAAWLMRRLYRLYYG